jgi:predicted RNase H-like HicB family nuclease
MRYPVIYEKPANGWGAYIPDLPGCVALGFTLEETKQFILESLELHLRSMREDGDPIPEPPHIVDVLEVAIQLDGFLKSHGIYQDYSLEDFEQERQALKDLGL